MDTLFSTTPAALAAAGLAASAVAWRSRAWGRPRALLGCVAAALAAVAVISEHVALFGACWLAASVLVSQGSRPTDLRQALGVLGDAVAVAALVAFTLDAGDGSLPWAGGAPPVPGWVLAGFVAGLSLRAAAGGVREPGLLALAAAVGMRMSVEGALADPAALAAAGVLAALVAWTVGPVASVPVLAGGLWGVGGPAASEAAAFVFAGGVVAAFAAAFRVPSRPDPAPAFFERRTRRLAAEGAPGGVFGGIVALLAVTPGVLGLLRVPLGTEPEGAVALIAGLAVLAAGASAAGARRVPTDLPIMRVVGGVVAASVLTLAFLAPGTYADVLDLGIAGEPGLVSALDRTRAGMAGAAAFAAVTTGCLLLVSGVRAGRPPDRPG